MKVIRAGEAVQLVWKLSTLDTTRLPSIVNKLYDPPTLPTITIIDPAHTIQVNALATARLSSGFYSYTYVTPSGTLVLPNQPNVWTAFLNLFDANGVPSGSADDLLQAKATQVFQLV